MNDQAEKERERVLQICRDRQDFYQDVDGFFYWWPKELRGHHASHQLRWIADELDRINEPWEKQIEKELNEL